MNYLELIVAFNRWKEVNPLPASAIALWYELVAICNKAGWPQEFTVPNAVLQSSAGLSKKQFDHARQLLINMGLINYKKSSRVNQAGKYSINYFPIVQKGKQDGKQEGIQEGKQEGIQEEHSGGNERGTLDKPKLKLNIYTTTAEEDAAAAAAETNEDRYNIQPIVEFYEQNGFGTVPPTLLEDLNYWIDQNCFDEPVEIIIRAMKEACLNNARKWRYVDKILVNWSSMNLRTLKQVEAYLQEYEHRKRKNQSITPEMDKPKKPKEPDIDPFLIRYGFRKVSDNAT